MISEQELTFRAGYPIFSVSAFLQTLKTLFNDTLPFIWLRGEISNLKISVAGHYYFSVKDTQAQIACVCFRGDAEQLNFLPKDGQQILLGGNPEIYSDRGQLQIIVRHLEPEGIGALALAFAKLKQKLEEEGLFSPTRKRPLPSFPMRVGIVTSPTGAVIQDILNISSRRFALAELVISPSRVQGQDAQDELVCALENLIAYGDIDIIIIARGGGSLEDLSPFNSEVLARAIAKCPIPIVSAVGHETDFSISDFVADLRAPTPSAASELVFPDQTELLKNLAEMENTLYQQIQQKLTWQQEQLKQALRYLKKPQQRLELEQLRLDERRQVLEHLLEKQLLTHRHHLAIAREKLQLLNPTQPLKRGYVLVRDKDNHVVMHAKQLRPGEHIALTFADGQATAQVLTKQP